MSITPLPPFPSSTDSFNFDPRADTWGQQFSNVTVNEINETAAAMNFNSTNGTSATSVLIGTGSKTFTASTGKSWQLGMTLRIARTSAPTNFMTGEVTAYNTGTGSLTVNVVSISGSGTFSDWTISQAGVSLQAPVLDLTSYSGADVALGVGQTAFYDFSAVSTLLLRVASATDQIYKLKLLFNVVTGQVGGAGVQLLPNNAVFGTSHVVYIPNYNNSGTWFNPVGVAHNVFTLHTDTFPYRIDSEISTRTQNKSVFSTFTSMSATQHRNGFVTAQGTEAATAWGASLGTLNFPFSTSGRAILTRSM